MFDDLYFANSSKIRMIQWLYMSLQQIFIKLFYKFFAFQNFDKTESSHLPWDSHSTQKLSLLSSFPFHTSSKIYTLLLIISAHKWHLITKKPHHLVRRINFTHISDIRVPRWIINAEQWPCDHFRPRFAKSVVISSRPFHPRRRDSRARDTREVAMQPTSSNDCLKTSLPVGRAAREFSRTELALWYIALFMGVGLSSMVECLSETTRSSWTYPVVARTNRETSGTSRFS